MADARNAVKALTQKALVTLGASDGDLDKIVIFPGRQIGFEDLRQFGQRTPKPLKDLVVVLLERDLYDDRFGHAQLFLIENGNVCLDVAVLLKEFDPLPAWARR